MGKKRAVSAIATTPVFPFPAAAADPPEPPHHFSDYGFDPQFLRFSQLPAAKRTATRRHHQTPPLEPARFKLQKPISKKHQNAQHNKQQRRRWWSSAASAALLFFKRPSSSPTAGASSTASSFSHNKTVAAFGPLPLYFTDDGGDDATGCTCWAPAMRSGHLVAAEFGAASAVISYVSLRDLNLGGGAGVGAPAMPIYLVT